MLNTERAKMRYFGSPTFDEAQYYQDNSFEMGGGDRQSSEYTGVYFPLLPKAGRCVVPFRKDEVLQEESWRALRANFKIDIRDIEVKAIKGIVSLTGRVNGLSEKREAGLCIEKIPGVLELVNELRIKKI